MIIGSGINIGSGVTISSDYGTDLYPFTVFNFTNAGATGNVGPTLSSALSTYNTASNTWLNNTSYYNVTSGVQYWTVPATGTYTVETWGANGAASSDTKVGRGAYVKGTFTLTQGEIIRIGVGQQGMGNVTRKDYPGGGGSFVVRSTFDSNASILTIAGGGGGVASDAPANISLSFGAITTWGNTSGDNTLGGNSGNGAGSSNQTVQGGAGFFTNGYNTNGVTNAANDLSRPRSFTNASPLLGGYVYWSGTSPSPGLPGGFGGGGGTDRYQPPPLNTAVNAMGGGGGYSGGGGGYSTAYVGGGGGSYNNGTNQVMTSNVRLGHGQVTITRIS